MRKALDIGLDDLDFEEPWLVVDAEVDGPVRFPDLWGVPQAADLQKLSVMMCDPKRPATIVPGRGNHRRWEFMLLPGEDDQAMMQPDAVAALDGDDLQQALALLEKKYYNKLNTPEDRRRVIAALARRGFSYGAIRAAMERLNVPDDEEI